MAAPGMIQTQDTADFSTLIHSNPEKNAALAEEVCTMEMPAEILMRALAATLAVTAANGTTTATNCPAESSTHGISKPTRCAVAAVEVSAPSVPQLQDPSRMKAVTAAIGMNKIPIIADGLMM